MSAAADAARFGPALDLVQGRVTLAHGAGGRATAALIAQVFLPALGNAWLHSADDGVVLPALGERLVMATDAHVVSPLFFPGGDIGRLAVHGTLNDVAMMGARPLYLSASFVLEEGLPLADLVRIANAMGVAAQEAGVPVLCADTKVVERGKGDGVFISTTGVGALPAGRELGGARAQVGDAVLVSGSIGRHGMAILAARGELGLALSVTSDSADLSGLIASLLDAVPTVRVLRDPTRGGVAATLNEIAHQSQRGIWLDEASLPVDAAVQSACELLGLDPLNLACEGRVLVVCPAEAKAAALETLRRHPLGAGAACIGACVAEPPGVVQMRTRLGGTRLIDWLSADPLPRIC